MKDYIKKKEWCLNTKKWWIFCFTINYSITKEPLYYSLILFGRKYIGIKWYRMKFCRCKYDGIRWIY